jgi:MerR HTH family regulatory protein
MGSQAARETTRWTISEAAGEIGVKRHVLKAWRERFSIFESPRAKKLSAFDLAAARALKCLLIDARHTAQEVEQLIAESGVAAVIAMYGAVSHARDTAASPALALQNAVRSAAAAGYFGEVYAEYGAESAGDGDAPGPVASHAQARLARLTGGK